MPKASQAIDSLPNSVQVSLELLGEHLRLGAAHECVRSDLKDMERGDPRVGMGVYATALWLMGRDEALRALAAPEDDAQALTKELLVIQNKGDKRHA